MAKKNVLLKTGLPALDKLGLSKGVVYVIVTESGKHE